MAGWQRCELASVRAVDIQCEDCGRTRRFQRPALLDLERKGVRTFPQLASRLYCRHCAERNGTGRNVSLRAC
jgi:hypothetical protein